MVKVVCRVETKGRFQSMIRVRIKVVRVRIRARFRFGLGRELEIVSDIYHNNLGVKREDYVVPDPRMRALFEQVC
jgi:hypothetical protein